MILSLLAYPVILGFFLWLMPRLEEMTLDPEERAAIVQGFVENESPEEVEVRVPDFLGGSVHAAI